MYEHVYNEMVEAGVPRKLDKSVWMNEKGEVVEDERDAFEKKLTHQIIRSEMFICFDDTWSNISMKGDGHIGGQIYLCAAGTTPQCKSYETEGRFTALGVMAFNGEPNMSVVVIMGKHKKA